MKIEELDLSIRAYHALRRSGIDTIEQLLEFSDEELLRYRSVGKVVLNEIREKLAAFKRRTAYEVMLLMSPEEMASYISGTICGGIISADNVLERLKMEAGGAMWFAAAQ